MSKELNQKQLEILKELGLGESQITLYLTSLQRGVLSVLQLSKLTGINRQQIYGEADRLVELGLYEVTGTQRRKYIAANPDRLLDVVRAKLERTEQVLSKVSSLLPSLQNMSAPKGKAVIVKYYEGLNKVKEAYDNELKLAKNTEVLSLTGLLEEIYEFFPETYWENWNKQFATTRSTARVLVQRSAAAETFAQRQKEYKANIKYLVKFPLKANIDVFNNIVLIVSFHDELAIWIESTTLAQSYRAMFDALWEQAKPFS